MRVSSQVSSREVFKLLGIHKLKNMGLNLPPMTAEEFFTMWLSKRSKYDRWSLRVCNVYQSVYVQVGAPTAKLAVATINTAVPNAERNVPHG